MTSSEIAARLRWWERADGPLYLRLAGGLRLLVEQGHLPAGAALPPERQLAKTLAVSRNTVSAAYSLLGSQGWVQARQGSGTVVSARRASDAAAHRADGVMASLLRQLGDAAIDLSVSAPAAAPIVARAFAQPQILFDDPTVLCSGHGYHAAGHPELRSAIADRMTAEGLRSTADDVLVTNGTQQAISLALEALVPPGAGLALEEISYPGVLDVAAHLGVRLHPLPVGPDGLDVGALAAGMVAHRIAAVFTASTFHNPTGTVMPADARRELATLAHRAGTMVIDDRTNAELDHGGAAPPPLGAFDGGSHVVTIGSMSKLYWGGLRIGWIRAQPALIDRLTDRKALEDLGSAQPAQLIAAGLLRCHHDAVRVWRNDQLRRSLDALTSSLATSLPHAEWTRPAGGPNLWIRLPDTDALAFSHEALHDGVALIAGPLLSARPGHATDQIRIPFYLPPDVLVTAVERLARAWRRHRRTATPDLR